MRFIIDPRKLVMELLKVTGVAIAAFFLFGWAIGIKCPYSIDYIGGGLLQVWPYLVIIGTSRAMEEGHVVKAQEKGEDHGDSADRHSVADADTTRAGE